MATVTREMRQDLAEWAERHYIDDDDMSAIDRMMLFAQACVNARNNRVIAPPKRVISGVKNPMDRDPGIPPLGPEVDADSTGDEA